MRITSYAFNTSEGAKGAGFQGRDGDRGVVGRVLAGEAATQPARERRQTDSVRTTRTPERVHRATHVGAGRRHDVAAVPLHLHTGRQRGIATATLDPEAGMLEEKVPPTAAR